MCFFAFDNNLAMLQPLHVPGLMPVGTASGYFHRSDTDMGALVMRLNSRDGIASLICNKGAIGEDKKNIYCISCIDQNKK
jgi:NADPH-dependent 7-cyano-7-deazaguanine reductase QueF-like protein